jgi:gliding motility-associated-like protein
MIRRVFILFFMVWVLPVAKGAVSFTYTSPLCGTLIGSFTNTTTGSNVGYLWFFDDPASGSNNYVINFTVTTQTHTFSTYGTYKVKLYALNASNQPVDSIENTIKVIAAPLLFLVPNTFPTYCNGDIENNFLTATLDPAYKYTWNPTPLSSSAPNSVEYAFSQTQTYTVTVTDTTTGCTNSKSITVLFENCDPLTSQFTFTPPPCGNYTVTFKNTSLTSHHYRWYFGDPASGANDSIYKGDSSSVNHTFSDTGYFNVMLVAFDSLETKADSSVKQVYIYKKSLATIFNSDTTICSGMKVNLSGMGLGTATWTPNTSLDKDTGYVVVASPVSTTKYYLTTYNNGCTATDSLLITVLNKPDPGFNTDTLCIDEAYTFNAALPGQFYYHWDFGTGDTANGESTTYSFDTSGTFNVKLRVSNGVCDSSTTIPVIVINDPRPVFQPDKFKLEITKATFQFSNMSFFATSYSWDFGDLTTSTSISPSHTYLDTGWFRVILTAYNSRGCSDTFSVMIRVDNVYLYHVPSAFSPNLSGPEENEVFKAFGPPGTTKYEMIIYDRWGQEIFASTDEKIPWEGKDADGRICPAENYVYSIKFKDPNGKRMIFKGIVTLCR